MISQFQNEAGGFALFNLSIGLLNYSMSIVKIDYGKY